jgi:hypothetical protein
MVSSTINPEYGRNSGAIINASIKSGTNQFHGDVFEFYRDTFLDAKSWFEPTAAPFQQNQYGGTIGGPIIKDHAFFFFSYQGYPEYLSRNNTQCATVYSAPERTGDFSADAASFNGTPGAAANGGPVNPNLSPFPMYGDSCFALPGWAARCARRAHLTVCTTPPATP